MHWLASHNRNEFLATPQLVRFDYAEGHSHHEPTLLIKANTLLLKYVISGSRLQLIVFRIDNHLVYAVKIWDDESTPAALWSVLEREEETNAFRSMLAGNSCQIFLFNELAVNVAWGETSLGDLNGVKGLISDLSTGSVLQADFEKRAVKFLDATAIAGNSIPDCVIVDIPRVNLWNPITSTYLTNSGGSSPINVFDQDEGSQQEQLALWLTENLQPFGCYHSPQIPKDGGTRELTDVLLSYDHGAFLVESKSLSILTREKLPTRKKLGSDTERHVQKALAQLEGAMRQLRGGATIKTREGKEINVEREEPAHCLVLIPDLDLIQNRELVGLSTIQAFMRATDAFIHLVDISELMRIVQAAEFHSSDSKKITAIQAFDYYLLKRSEVALESKTLLVQVLHQFPEKNRKKV